MSGHVLWGAATPAAEEWLARRWEAIAEAFARKGVAIRHAAPDASEDGWREANAALATAVVADASWQRGDVWWRWCSAHPCALAFPVYKPLLPPPALAEIPAPALAFGAERLLADAVLDGAGQPHDTRAQNSRQAKHVIGTVLASHPPLAAPISGYACREIGSTVLP